MTDKYVCNFCAKQLSSRSTLIRHQKSTKMCIDIQRSKGLIPILYSFTCEHCEKTFTIKESMNRHMNTCPKKFIKISIEQLANERLELSEAKQQLEQRETFIQSLASRPTTTTINKYIQNFKPELSLINISVPEVKTIAKESFNDRHFLRGIKGLADFALESVINIEGKQIYVCTDKARNKFKFVDETGMIVDDPGANYLLEKLQYGTINMAEKYFTDKKDEVSQHILDDRLNQYKNFSSYSGAFQRCIKDKLPSTMDRSKFSVKLEEEKRLESEREKEIQRDCNEFLARDRIISKMSGMTMEEIAQLRDAKCFVKFLVHIILKDDEELAYKHELNTENFYYYINEDDKLERKVELEPYYIIDEVFGYIVDGIYEVRRKLLSNIKDYMNREEMDVNISNYIEEIQAHVTRHKPLFTALLKAELMMENKNAQLS